MKTAQLSSRCLVLACKKEWTLLMDRKMLGRERNVKIVMIGDVAVTVKTACSRALRASLE